VKSSLAVVVVRESEEPVYAQIARQIRTAVSTRELGSGDPLPSVRRLASDLGVNLNTVARAYRLLEEDGFIRIRDRSGAVVVAPAPRIAASARASLEQNLKELLARMRQAGLATQELRDWAMREIDLLGEPPEERG
jgi:DNA-binding transcriptional regulator YhcF (GntR family)